MNYKYYRRDKNVNNEELIYKARSGCKHSEDSLIKNNISLVVTVSKKWNKSIGIEFDDLISYGLAELHIAYKNFNFEKNKKFASLLRKCIDNRFAKLYRYENQEMRNKYGRVSIDETHFERDVESLHSVIADENAVIVEQHVIQSVLIQNILSNFLKNASNTEKIILHEHYNERKTFKEIGIELGISETSAIRAHKSIIAKLREISLEQNLMVNR